MNKKRVVITGGPGTGKTSIINTLKKRGFYCFDEVIRSLTLEAKKEIEADLHISNPIAFTNDPKDFNTKLLNGRVEQFKNGSELDHPIVFFDRGIPDVLAYMDFFNQEYDDVFTNACKTHTYSNICLLPPWKEIYKTDNERFESYEEALEIHEALVSIYKKFNYTILEVPFGTVEERTNFILDALK
ncbi:AAA family ATPase [Seonamhaeicola marinus]|uniref:ATP-binding protein n=1 Tax=Seonamhaeicola marinus TaxID=1912246 RepID=A0A5D0I4U3_9FLAO|nr:ATP-binding protein [Seonamhaeicola marinus]TYA78388.1 ATP-binding protein [Seonamhaeicola marinus]